MLHRRREDLLARTLLCLNGEGDVRRSPAQEKKNGKKRREKVVISKFRYDQTCVNILFLDHDEMAEKKLCTHTHTLSARMFFFLNNLLRDISKLRA